MKRIDAVEECHRFARRVVSVGDLAVDATAGNGFDTALLCELVGERGRVISIDRQPAAVAATRLRIERMGFGSRCVVVEDDHQYLTQILEAQAAGKRPSIVMFNLGYLPGGDKTVVTEPGSTVAALHAALDAIQPGGAVSIVVYRGHEGASEEAASVEETLSGSQADRFTVERLGFGGYPEHRPYVVLIRAAVAD